MCAILHSWLLVVMYSLYIPWHMSLGYVLPAVHHTGLSWQPCWLWMVSTVPADLRRQLCYAGGGGSKLHVMSATTRVACPICKCCYCCCLQQQQQASL